MLDTHTHVWEEPRPSRPWVNDFLIDRIDSFDVDVVYDAESLLADMDDNDIDAAVVVSYPITDPYDNSTVVETTRAHERLRGIGIVDPFADDAADQLRALMSNERIIGVRIGAIYPREDRWRVFDDSAEWLDEVLDAPLWDAAKETDALIQILADISQVDQIERLVETHPELSYLLDHFLQVDPSNAPESSPFADLRTLSSYSNVAMKVSAAPHISNESFPYRDLHEYVRWLIEQFGRERTVWGSDYPNVSDTTTYADTYEWLEHVECLSTSDRRWLTGRSFEWFLDQSP